VAPGAAFPALCCAQELQFTPVVHGQHKQLASRGIRRLARRWGEGLAHLRLGDDDRRLTSSDAFCVSFAVSFSSHSSFFSGGSCERTRMCTPIFVRPQIAQARTPLCAPAPCPTLPLPYWLSVDCPVRSGPVSNGSRLYYRHCVGWVFRPVSDVPSARLSPCVQCVAARVAWVLAFAVIV